MLPLEVNKLGHEEVVLGSVMPYRELKRVVLIPWEAEAVVEEKELVRAVSVAIEQLVTSLDCLPILVHEVEVRVISVLLGDKPIELFFSLFTVRLLGGFLRLK